MPQYSDPGIPTLTQRAEPTLAPDAGAPGAGAARGSDLPVLTQVADLPGSAAQAGAAGGDSPQAAWSTAAGAAGDTVLRAALQAELEQTLQRALDDATAGLRARLEAELPALIDRAVRGVRPG